MSNFLNNVTIYGSLSTSSSITGTKFYGDGSTLTNVITAIPNTLTNFSVLSSATINANTANLSTVNANTINAVTVTATTSVSAPSVSATYFYGDATNLTNIVLALPNSLTNFNVLSSATINANTANLSTVNANTITAFISISSPSVSAVNINAYNKINGSVITASTSLSSPSISALYFYGDASKLNNLTIPPTLTNFSVLSSATINANVANLSTANVNTLNASTATVTTSLSSPSISAAYLYGNGNGITGILNSALPSIATNFSVLSSATINANTANLSTANIGTANVVTANLSSAYVNTLSGGTITATGSISSAGKIYGDGTGIYNIGAGSLPTTLTNLQLLSSQNINANTANLSTINTNTITAFSSLSTPSISANYFYGDGSNLKNLPAQVYTFNQVTSSITTVQSLNILNSIPTSTLQGYYTYIGGGYNNAVQGVGSVIAGGINNRAYLGPISLSGSNSILGGYNNNAGDTTNHTYGITIGGGNNNTANGNYAFIGGGLNNQIYGNFSAILGGQSNYTTQPNTFLLGSNLTASQTGFTYVNAISSQGAVYGIFYGDGSNITAISATALPVIATNFSVLSSTTINANTANISSLNAGTIIGFTSISSVALSGNYYGNGAGLYGITNNALPLVATNFSVLSSATINANTANISSLNAGTITAYTSISSIALSGAHYGNGAGLYGITNNALPLTATNFQVLSSQTINANTANLSTANINTLNVGTITATGSISSAGKIYGDGTGIYNIGAGSLPTTLTNLQVLSSQNINANTANISSLNAGTFTAFTSLTSPYVSAFKFYGDGSTLSNVVSAIPNTLTNFSVLSSATINANTANLSAINAGTITAFTSISSIALSGSHYGNGAGLYGITNNALPLVATNFSVLSSATINANVANLSTTNINTLNVGTITATGSISSAGKIYGDGSQLGGILNAIPTTITNFQVLSSATINANTANLSTINAGTITATGYISAAGRIYGDGSQLGGIINAIPNTLTNFSVLSSATINANTANLSAINAGTITVNTSLSAPAVSATYFYGNGNGITSITNNALPLIATNFQVLSSATVNAGVANLSSANVRNITVYTSVSAPSVSANYFYGDGSNLININPSVSFNTQTLQSYTIALSDNGVTIASTNASGLTAIISNIPNTYPTGFNVNLLQLTTGRITVSAQNNFTNINQSNGFFKTSKQYSVGTLLYTGTQYGWVLFGDISA